MGRRLEGGVEIEDLRARVYGRSTAGIDVKEHWALARRLCQCSVEDGVCMRTQWIGNCRSEEIMASGERHHLMLLHC